MTIVLDLDDVLANLRESLYQILTPATGVDLHWRYWTHYDLEQHYALVKDYLNRILIENQVLETCQPEPGAARATQALRQLGWRIAIVTARGWHPHADLISRDWLQTHGIVYDYLQVVPLGGNKLEALKPLSKVELAVDDHPDHVKRYVRANIPALLMDRPWNVDFPGERIYSLEAMVDHVSRRYT